MFRNKDKKKKDFDEFIEDEEFEKILREMEKIVGDAFNTALDGWESEKSSAKRFSIKMNSDGKVKLDEINNALSESDEYYGSRSADVIENKDSVSVTIEVPDANKEDIVIEVSDDEIEVQDNIYNRRIKLPSEVKPETTKATYKNGVLDVEIKKKVIGKEGYSISID